MWSVRYILYRYTTRHLHQRIDEDRASAVGAHVKGCQEISNPELLKQFSVLNKCQGKLDCLIRKVLFIREKKPILNTQSDSIRAKPYLFRTFKRARTNSLADVVNNHLILNLNWPLHLSLENKVKMTSKRRVISLIFVIKCISTFSCMFHVGAVLSVSASLGF